MKHKVYKPNVVRGGAAVPLGANYYYMTGRKHSQGGIDIGHNPKTGLEVEDGEVMHVGKNNVKVFSSVPFINGKSPAERVMNGDNPNKVFNAQERFKKRNKINDDGTKKKRMGGQSPNRKYTTKLTADEEKQFQDWYSKVSKYKNLNPNPDADGQDYDYRGYWKNEDRNGILSSNSNVHFTDKYKQPSHPTFSNESKYSTKETPGGEWVKGKGTWLFKHNKFTARQVDRTADYLNGTGEGFILGTDTIIPNRKRAGGLYSVTSNGRTKLYPFPSTGEWDRSSDKSKRAKKVGGGPKGINPDLYEKEDEYEYNPSLSPKVNDELREEHIEAKRRSTIGQNPNPTNNSSSNATIIKDTDKKPEESWFKRTTKNVKKYVNDNSDVVADSIGLTSNIIGGLISYKMNKDMLNKLKYNSSPIARKAAKLKTRININPQLDKMRETLAAYERSVDNNTASSRVALARKQRARLANMMSTNELYANKENIETELINKDRLNQQSITDANIRDYNTWAEKRAAFRNAVEEKKGENAVSLINTINAGIQDTIARREKRDAERQTLLAMIAGRPNVNPRMFRDMGIKGITDKEIKAFDKVYGKKKKNKKSSKKD